MYSHMLLDDMLIALEPMENKQSINNQRNVTKLQTLWFLLISMCFSQLSTYQAGWIVMIHQADFFRSC